MRFTVQSDDINHSLNLVTRALPQRSPKDVYEGVFIETTEEGVQLTCTNGEMSIKTLAPAIIAEDGCALLPATLLAELLRKMNGEISIQTEDAQKALINAEGSKTTMMCLDAGDFPDIEDISGGFVTTLPQNRLREAVSRIIFAISADETRPILTGCLMETYPEDVRFVCLDGFRLAMQRVTVSHSLPAGKETQSSVLPGSIIGEISRMVEDSGEPVELHCTASHLMAKFNKTKVYCPLIPGEYINYKQILPATWTTAIRVDKAQAMSAIERAALIARESSSYLLKIKVDEDNLTIMANAERSSVVEKVSIDFEGSPIDIAFNARYLIDVIKNIDTPDLALRFNTNVSPCVICPVSGNQYTYLVLPVRVSE